MTTEADFLKDVAQHQMIVVRDEGVHRHIRFKQPGTSIMHFDLITWPGHLCYTGDMGTYVFSRLDDMFEFFRTDREYMRSRGKGTLGINLGYWAEKVLSQDRHDGIKRFSEERFNRAVMTDLVRWIRENAHQTTKDDRRDLWDAVVSDVIHADEDSAGYRKQIAAHDFNYRVNGHLAFQFQDFWEHTVDDYTHRFIWCCYALAWGIQQYDDARQTAAKAA